MTYPEGIEEFIRVRCRKGRCLGCRRHDFFGNAEFYLEGERDITFQVQCKFCGMIQHGHDRFPFGWISMDEMIDFALSLKDNCLPEKFRWRPEKNFRPCIAHPDHKVTH